MAREPGSVVYLLSMREDRSREVGFFDEAAACGVRLHNRIYHYADNANIHSEEQSVDDKSPLHKR